MTCSWLCLDFHCKMRGKTAKRPPCPLKWPGTFSSVTADLQHGNAQGSLLSCHGNVVLYHSPTHAIWKWEFLNETAKLNLSTHKASTKEQNNLKHTFHIKAMKNSLYKPDPLSHCLTYPFLKNMAFHSVALGEYLWKWLWWKRASALPCLRLLLQRATGVNEAIESHWQHTLRQHLKKGKLSEVPQHISSTLTAVFSGAEEKQVQTIAEKINKWRCCFFQSLLDMLQHSIAWFIETNVHHSDIYSSFLFIFIKEFHTMSYYNAARCQKARQKDVTDFERQQCVHTINKDELMVRKKH